jgi:hypothetical protein
VTITTTVAWADLHAALDDELADVRDAYDDLAAHATEEYGDEWRTATTTDDTLAALQDQAERYDQTARSIQQRRQMLDRLEEEYGSGDFEVKLLTGSETMAIETDLRLEAQQRDIDLAVIQTKRNALTVDAAVVDAPEGVPRDDDGSPTPSECPNALTLALWEQVERFNNAGDPDFTAAGLSDASDTTTSVTSATPTPASDS